jgi:DNA-binding HxlR family transcriptional regulator
MPSTPSLDDHIRLAQGRWTAALLADLAAHGGARFVELLNRIGVSRDSLSRTLEAATAQGWIERNPGYGHPLRPEYVLTSEGKRMAMLAVQIDLARRTVGIEPGGLARWSVPIICSINAGNRRFNELSRALRPASPRALSQGLRRLSEQQLVTRELLDGYPPASLYSLTRDGMILAQAA